MELAGKATFNQEEAAEFYGFSRRRLFRLLEQDHLPFLLMYNKRKLIDREKFEAYLNMRPELKESLKRQAPRSTKQDNAVERS